MWRCGLVEERQRNYCCFNFLLLIVLLDGERKVSPQVDHHDFYQTVNMILYDTGLISCTASLDGLMLAISNESFTFFGEHNLIDLICKKISLISLFFVEKEKKLT